MLSKDLVEETDAARAVIAHLAGKPIVGTSGNVDHKIKPVLVGFNVDLTEKGDELAIFIKQEDRHHPHLVYDTIVSGLSELEALKKYTPEPIRKNENYYPDEGVFVVRYDLPKGVADSVIHSLSEHSAKQPEIIALADPIPAEVIDNVIKYFSGNSVNNCKLL